MELVLGRWGPGWPGGGRRRIPEHIWSVEQSQTFTWWFSTWLKKWRCKKTTRSLIAFLRRVSFQSQFLSFQEELLVCQASCDWSPLCSCRGTYKGGKERPTLTHVHKPTCIWETFSAAPTPRPVVLRAFTLLWHILLCTPGHRALSSVILAATAPFRRPLRDFPPNNRVGRDTRQNRALAAIIQTLGVNNDTFMCEKEWSSILCTEGNIFQLAMECCRVYLSIASLSLYTCLSVNRKIG